MMSFWLSVPSSSSMAANSIYDQTDVLAPLRVDAQRDHDAMLASGSGV